MSRKEEQEVLVAGFVWDRSLFGNSWDCFDCCRNQVSNTCGFLLRENPKIKLCNRCMDHAIEIEEAIKDVEADIQKFEHVARETEADNNLLEGAKTAQEQLRIRVSDWQAKVKQGS